MALRQPVIQNAYVVNDLDEAMQRWHALWGLGPFLVRRHMAMAQVLYRGAPSRLDMSAAFVQAGPLQLELVQQHCQTPSAFRDMFAPGAEGFHHVAVQAPDPQQALAHYRARGCAPVTELRTASGRGAVLVDTRPLLGHMTEVYLSPDLTLDFYRQVAEAADQWDGRQLSVELDAT